MSVQLHDRFTQRSGEVVITGVQALVRLMLLQADRDRAASLNTAGFVCGYRGSPLGTLDMAFAGAAPLPEQAGVRLLPAVNEELAATAIAGTQQIEHSPGRKVDGIFSLWYGKGPGLDRAADAVRHGNAQGSSRHGGVVVAVGDDHAAKSSSLACYSDDTVVSLRMPLFSPSTPHEITLFGLHAFAASRFSGSWIALKVINEVADSTQTISADELDAPFEIPDSAPTVDVHYRWPVMQLEQEAVQLGHRLPAVLDYVHVNRLDRIVQKDTASRTGLIAAGKSWLDVLEALRLLGLDEARLRARGIALYKPAMIWPLEPQTLASFAEGLDEIIVVEEKTGLIEDQVKKLLYGAPQAPRVFGKHNADGSVLFQAASDLSPERIACELGRKLGSDGSDMDCRMERVERALAGQAELALPPAIRKPFFCSGCPHNRSTIVPEGSRATAGIGCHGLAAWMRSDTTTFSQMGGEGMHWVGQAPFTDEPHMFANLGDGTYFHSGILAIRQAVAAKVNITYKLLYNSAVAMTGGQSVDGELSVERLIRQLQAEGVDAVVVSTDDPDRYPAGSEVRKLADKVEHRDDLEGLQRDLRAKAGVSVIIYEQMCATEKRRLRKRGKMEDPATRVFINDLVCEGCGDCSVKSNCLSVEPVETEFGTKRRINQATCNKDMSCLNGFCPSLVTVTGGKFRAKANLDQIEREMPHKLPQPALPNGHRRILVAGIGGTGVVTIGALLSMAGFLGRKKIAVLDLLGAAQKGGAVTSHVHISDGDIAALRIPAGEADVVIACDQIVGNARDVIASIDRDKTFVLANADVAITGDFTQNPTAVADPSLLARRLGKQAGEGRFVALPFTRLAEALVGDAIGSNLMMMGFAFQKGWLPVAMDFVSQAIELNGVAKIMNLAAFEWGRQLAHDVEAVYRISGIGKGPAEAEAIDQVIDRRAAFLADYQNAAYAARYRTQVERVWATETSLVQTTELTDAVARALFRLMAYKDEYEVARLHRSTAFAKVLNAQFEGDFKLTLHMAPPMLSPRDPVTGHLRKRSFGQWILPVLGALAKAKGLRGTAFDPFGRTAERQMERALIGEYEALIDMLLGEVSVETLPRIVQIARLASEIRGYGHVKEQSVSAYREQLSSALAAMDETGENQRAPARAKVLRQSA
jgi:indolepyruvate ferredoxin oxidoreductase